MEQHAISSDLIRGHIDTIILHTLLNGDKFAQQISDAIEEKSEKEYKINQATLYSSLKRLETLRYVKSYWNDSENGRRKFFKLTETGRETVETNLSSWSFSRAIIDKLMDCTPQPVIKTQYIDRIIEKPVEKIIERPVEIIKEVSPADVIKPQIQSVENELSTKPDDNVKVAENTVKSTDTVTNDNVQDINFRNILNGLIKSTVIQKNTAKSEELQPLKKADVSVEKTPEIQKFNETITTIDYNAQKSNNGKIDFGDLTLKAAKEGYKIRISSKDSYVTKGSLLLNKLNAFTAIFTYLLALIPLLIVSLVIGKNSIISGYVAIIGAISFAVAPAVYMIKYLIDPKNSSPKRVNRDEILTAVIIVFNVLVVTLAANLIFKVDFTNITTVAYTLILPVVLSFVFIMGFIVKYSFSKSNTFKVSGK